MKKVHFVLGDINKLSPSLRNKFDFSISSGVAEHFKEESRKKVILNHIRILKTGGLTFICVPYTYCPYYWIHRKICEAKCVWGIEEEWPFSKREIKNIRNTNKYHIVKIFGSTIIADLLWLFPPPVLLKLLTRFKSKKIKQLEENTMYYFRCKKIILGNLIGYTYTVIAEKNN